IISEGRHVRRWSLLGVLAGVEVVDGAAVVWRPNLAPALPQWAERFEIELRSPDRFVRVGDRISFLYRAGNGVIVRSVRLNGQPLPFRAGVADRSIDLPATAEFARDGFKFRIGLERNGLHVFVERSCDVPLLGVLVYTRSGW